MAPKKKSNPPGRIKIMKSFAGLMGKKDFHSITTAEIAGRAGVTEGLIYKYFKDKKDLLYQVLNDYFIIFLDNIQAQIVDKKSCVEKLEVIISTSLESYVENRIFSRILLLEVRNSAEFFNSDAYEKIRVYARIILDTIEKGIKTGELKPDIDAVVLRKVILGSIEHACLGGIIFKREVDAAKISSNICKIVFNGAKA